MSARSLLYVPGHKPEMFPKAATSGADAIILDLEDAVPLTAKEDARAAVVMWLAEKPERPPVWVRINSGELLLPDARAIIATDLDGIYVPKASPADLEGLDAILGERELPVTALVETAAGVLDARAIAEFPRVVRLAIGEADLGSEIGVTGDAMLPMRMQVVLASAAAGLDPPVGPVATDFKDLDALRESSRALRASGFGGRAAIHPAQVPVINEAFTPTAEEVDAARRLLKRFAEGGGGVTTDDEGRMIDEAVVRAARRTIALVNDA